MCGVAGTYHWPDGGPLTERLTAAVEHRGPDGSGHYGHAAGDGEVHLGHRRLSIVDLSETGAQPMTRHNSHAWLTARALRTGKAAFVEKPLALDDAGLDGKVLRLDAFLDAVRGGRPMPIALDSLAATARATLAVATSLASGAPVPVRAPVLDGASA